MEKQDQKQQIMEILHKLKRLGHSQMNMHISGIAGGEFSMLMGIHHFKEHGQAGGGKGFDLAEWSKTTMPAISQMLGHLEKKGLIERRPDSKDRRRVSVLLTDKGEQTMECAFRRFARFVELVVERLGEADTERMIELFSRLYKAIQEVNESGCMNVTGEEPIC